MMPSPYEGWLDRPFRAAFGPLIWPRTYARLLYLMIGFPLGLAWFVFYSVGVSLGIGLAILSIGVVLLAVVALAAVPLGLLERGLATALLGVRIAPTGWTAPDGNGWTWFKATLRNPVTWKAHLFLFTRFPLGLFSWVAVVVGGSVALSFIAAPIALVWDQTSVNLGPWSPDTPVEGLPLTLIGLVALVLFAHLVNGMGWLWGAFAGWALGRREASKAAPAPEAARVPNGTPALA